MAGAGGRRVAGGGGVFLKNCKLQTPSSSRFGTSIHKKTSHLNMIQSGCKLVNGLRHLVNANFLGRNR